MHPAHIATHGQYLTRSIHQTRHRLLVLLDVHSVTTPTSSPPIQRSLLVLLLSRVLATSACLFLQFSCAQGSGSIASDEMACRNWSQNERVTSEYADSTLGAKWVRRILPRWIWRSLSPQTSHPVRRILRIPRYGHRSRLSPLIHRVSKIVHGTESEFASNPLMMMMMLLISPET